MSWIEGGYPEHLLGISLGLISEILAVKGNSTNIGKQRSVLKTLK